MRAQAVCVVLILWSCHRPEADSKRSVAIVKPTPPMVAPSPAPPAEDIPKLDPSEPGILPIPIEHHPRVSGRQLLVKGRPFTMRAVCWNPVRKGAQHPNGLLFRDPSANDLQQIEQDFQLMTSMGVNTLRTYEAILDTRVLALVQKYQLHMIVPVFNYFATDMADVTARVQKLKDHPGTLFWEIGNEWNYNQFYSVGQSPIGLEAAKELVKKVITTVRTVDQRLPIATVYGEMPSRALVDELSGIDIWGLNIYSGLSFGTRLQSWQMLSDKPMYLGEYGADAINQTEVDELSQAKAVVALTQEIQNSLSAQMDKNVSIGGAIFEWNDEWWKDAQGSPDQHDKGGLAPGGGPYPDMVFNEEWWGIVDIDRKPRAAYNELKKLWKPDALEETF